MSAHLKLLTVNTEGSVPAPEEATRETAPGNSRCSQWDQLPALALYQVQGSVVWVGWGERQNQQGKEGHRPLEVSS